jgi:hypothetical protein
MLDGDRRYPVATPIFSFVVAGAVAVTNIAYTPTFHF